MAMSVPWIQVEKVSKSYGGVRAIEEISLDIAAGEIHALCGENGAGKSTLIKILSGAVTPESGQVLVDGKPLALGSVVAAEAAGIVVIHQESTAFPDLSAVDNLFLGNERRRFGGWLLDYPKMQEETQAQCNRLGLKLDIHRPVGEYPLATRQMVAIARALLRNSRLLILDEPTASLSRRECEALFAVIHQLQTEGVGILYVSHRLEEVFALADRVTVLRDGYWVDTTPIAEIDQAGLIQKMVGREIAEERWEDSNKPIPDAPVVLSVQNLSREGVFSEISFSVCAGEVVGLGGLMGAGRTEVARAIFGADCPTTGTVQVGGQRLVPGSIASAVSAGIAMVPEDRQHQGLHLPMTVRENLTLTVLGDLANGGIRNRHREQETARILIDRLRVRTASQDLPATALSGGNQQKLVLGKWLARKPRLLILDEPTRGVDVGAKAEIYAILRELCAEGMAVLLISSDLPELLALSDRILVLREGQYRGELTADKATPETVMALALEASGEKIAAVTEVTT
jgi:ABC-type sugar transport system ATPase subunit